MLLHFLLVLTPTTHVVAECRELRMKCDELAAEISTVLNANKMLERNLHDKVSFLGKLEGVHACFFFIVFFCANMRSQCIYFALQERKHSWREKLKKGNKNWSILIATSSWCSRHFLS